MENERIIEMLKDAGTGNAMNLYMELYNLNRGIMGSVINRFDGIIEREDAEQESFFALLDAVKDYNPNKSKFSTYYAYRINQHLKQYAAETQTAFTICRNDFWKIRKYENARMEFFQQWQHYPNEVTIAAIMETTPEEIRKLAKLSKQLNSKSMDDSIPGYDSEIILSDTIPSDEDIEADYIDRDCKENVNAALCEMLEELTGLPFETIRTYYDLKAGDILPEELTEITGLDAETIRNKINYALHILKKRNGIERAKLKRIAEENGLIYSMGIRPGSRSQWIYSTEYAAIKLYEMDVEKRLNHLRQLIQNSKDQELQRKDTET